MEVIKKKNKLYNFQNGKILNCIYKGTKQISDFIFFKNFLYVCEESRLKIVDVTTNTEKEIIKDYYVENLKRYFFPKLHLYNQKIYIQLDYTIEYDPETKISKGIDTYIEKQEYWDGITIDSEKLRFFEEKMYVSKDYTIYLVENNTQKVFFVQKEKYTHNFILDFFISKETIKIIVSDGWFYTYCNITKKLISEFSIESYEIYKAKFSVCGKYLFCPDDNIIFKEKNGELKIYSECGRELFAIDKLAYYFINDTLTCTQLFNPVYEILLPTNNRYDFKNDTLFDYNVIKIISDFVI
jgi:hypothetical protein